LPGWTLLGAGAYFAYVEHPYDLASDELAQKLVQEAAILMLPGTMFAPRAQQGGTGSAERQMRVAFANVNRAELQGMFARLKGFSA